jgi:hypothetical protein
MSLPFTMGTQRIDDLQHEEKDWREISAAIRADFQRNAIKLSSFAFVLGDEASGWRLVDYQAGEPRAYDIAATAQGLEVRQHSTSGLSTVLTDYPVFPLGFKVREYASGNGADVRTSPRQDVFTVGMLRDGRARELLDDEQRQRWDYFFPLSRAYVGLPHRRRIRGWRKEMDNNETRLPKQRRKVVLFAALAAVLMTPLIYATIIDSSFACLPFLGLVGSLGCGVAALTSWLSNRRLRTRHANLQSWIDSLEKEENDLQTRADNHPVGPSSEQIRQWLQEDLKRLDRRAIGVLGLETIEDEEQTSANEDIADLTPPSTDPEHTPLQLPEHLNPRQLNGILLESWGLIQSSKAHGIDDIDSLHLGSVRIGRDGRLHFGVHFFQFILPTGMQLAVYGCFWDFILRKEKGMLTDEFFYSDVVSLRSRISRVHNSLSSEKASETTVFSLTVASNDSIDVSLTDKNVLDDMGRRMKKRRKNEQEQLREVREEEGENAVDEASPVFEEFDSEYDSEELPATRGAATLAFIRPLLRKHHQRPDSAE